MASGYSALIMIAAATCLCACHATPCDERQARLSASHASKVIAPGDEIDSVVAAMAAAKYSESALAVMSQPDERPYFWTVDEGVLVVTASEDTQRVVKMSYWLSDGRSKFTRKTFTFSVESFDPRTGRMVLSTKRS